MINRAPKRLTLRAPPPSTEGANSFHPNIVAWRFPEWFIVQRPEVTAKGYRRRRLVHMTSLEDNCKYYRDRDYGRQAVVPIRTLQNLAGKVQPPDEPEEGNESDEPADSL